jgi:hypothetical protein
MGPDDVRNLETATEAKIEQEHSRRRRHSIYTQEIGRAICYRIVEGESLRQICQDASMPGRSTVFLWLQEHEEFARSYTLAKRLQIDDLLGEVIKIVDDDWVYQEGPDGKKYRIFNPDSFRRSKQQLAARHSRIAALQ